MSIMKMYVEEYLAAEQVAEDRYIIHPELFEKACSGKADRQANYLAQEARKA